ncbi:MAG: M20/M25/M40 family metallo-hydrolase [bacterium]
MDSSLESLRGAIGRGYLKLAGRGDDAGFFYAWEPAPGILADEGVAYSVILEDLGGADLYLVPRTHLADRADVAAVAAILREDASFWLVAAKEEDALGIYGLPAKQRLVGPLETGLPLKVARQASEAPAYQAYSYDPAIQALVDSVSESNLYDRLSTLSGEDQALIGGEPYTILTRYSPVPGCRQAGQYLLEQFQAIGVSAEYDYFNFRKFLYSVTFPVDDVDGWVVGGSVILHTGDGGQVWAKQEDGTDATLKCVFMLDNQTGWVAGFDGTILMTEDGATWEALSCPTTNDLSAVYFPDASTGYICGALGTILKSTNGGQTWTKLTSGTTKDLTGVWFVSASEGWVVGDTGLIRKTSDGGASWQTATSPVATDLTSVEFTSQTNGVITGLAGVVLRTTDGSTWQRVTIPVTDALYSVFFLNGSTGWACGDGGAMIKTTNGGATWTDQSTYINFQFRDVCFVDFSEGWVVGNATLQHSLDGGATWDDEMENVQAGDVNVVATIPGTTNPEEIYIICGHYDDTSQIPYDYAPGADDNATGTIATVEAARVLKEAQFEATLKFLCVSREEQGLVGSGAYASEAYANGDSIVGVINFDMIGYVDVVPEDIDIAYNGFSAWLSDAYEAASALYVPDLAVNPKLAPGLTGSDHSSFWNRGYPAFCGISDTDIHNPYYHRTGDRVNTLNFDFYTLVVKGAVATLAELARLDVSSSVPSVTADQTLKVGPNPGRGEITIEMAATPGKAQTVRVFDVSGRLVMTIEPAVQNGFATARWLGDDAAGGKASPGVYFVKVQGSERTTKVVLVK